jgi:hypothetical protein
MKYDTTQFRNGANTNTNTHTGTCIWNSLLTCLGGGRNSLALQCDGTFAVSVSLFLCISHDIRTTIALRISLSGVRLSLSLSSLSICCSVKFVMSVTLVLLFRIVFLRYTNPINLAVPLWVMMGIGLIFILCTIAMVVCVRPTASTASAAVDEFLIFRRNWEKRD